MSTRSKIQILLVVSVMFFTGIACQLFEDLQQVSETKDTAEAFITEADVGLETVESFVTEIGVEITESGIMETMDAAITEFPMPTLDGEKPADIPVMEGSKTALMESANFVSYIIDLAYQNVVDYYEREMVANGWVKVDSETQKQDSFAQLTFEKDGRKAVVLITEVPFLEQTSVSIEIK